MLAIIPARGGSKRLPGKNIRNFCGKPLLAYTIVCALSSKYITQVLVSTDDEEIAKVAHDCGAEVPELRPAELAGDSIGTWDVILWHLERMKHQKSDLYNKQYYNIAEVAVLQATSPLRTAKHLDEAIEKFRALKVDTLISVSAQSHRPEWCFYEDQQKLKPYFPTDCSAYPSIPRTTKSTTPATPGYPGANIPTNHVPLMPNGAIFLLRTEALRQNKSHINENMTSYTMPAALSVDIDTQEDWDLAELILTSGKYSGF